VGPRHRNPPDRRDTRPGGTALRGGGRSSTAVEALHHTEKELEERTAWALRLQDEARRLEEQVALFRASRWVKLGRTVGLGPFDMLC